MALHLRCSCGREFEIPEQAAGKRIRCRTCGQVLTAPELEPLDVIPVVEAAPAADDGNEAPTLEPVDDEAPAAQPPARRTSQRGRIMPPPPARPTSTLGVWWYFAYHHSMLGVFLMFALVGPGLLGVLGAVQKENKRYAMEGVAIQGVVLSKSRSWNSRQRGWNHEVRYRYSPAPGSAYEGTQGVSGGIWTSVAEGSAVPVTYLRSEPRLSRLALTNLEDATKLDQAMWYVLAALILLSAAATVISWRRIVGRMRLLRQGERALAEIAEVREKQFLLRYCYVDAAGGRHEAQIGWPRWQDYAVGDYLVVAYDATQPNRHVVDFLGVRYSG